MRWLALGAPFAWFGFATHFRARDIVGANFFQRFAESVHAEFSGRGTDCGLMDSMDDLGTDRFDPAKVHPIIREFYEHTSRFDLDVTIRWNPLVRPLAWLYKVLAARRMQQLIIPLDQSDLSGLDSWLELIDLDHAGKPEFRCWIRVDKDSRIPVYVGAYKTYVSMTDGYKVSYVSVAFPIPGGTMTTVLVPSNHEGNGFMLTTRAPGSSESGVYFVFPHEHSFTLTPAFGLSERFRLTPTQGGQGVHVVHDCFWLGVFAFEMIYTITRMAQRDRRHGKALVQAIKAPEGLKAAAASDW